MYNLQFSTIFFRKSGREFPTLDFKDKTYRDARKKKVNAKFSSRWILRHFAERWSSMRTGAGTITLGQFHRVLFRLLNFHGRGGRLYPRDAHVPYRLWNILEFLRNEARVNVIQRGLMFLFAFYGWRVMIFHRRWRIIKERATRAIGAYG